MAWMPITFITELERSFQMNEYEYDQIEIGMNAHFHKTITAEMEEQFRQLSGDDNPLHRDDGFAQVISKGVYKSHVAFGMLVAAMYSTMAGMYLPGKYSLIHSINELSFMKPVFVGDKLDVIGTVVDKIDDLRLLILKVIIKNQDNRIVSKAKMRVLVMK